MLYVLSLHKYIMTCICHSSIIQSSFSALISLSFDGVAGAQKYLVLFSKDSGLGIIKSKPQDITDTTDITTFIRGTDITHTTSFKSYRM